MGKGEVALATVVAIAVVLAFCVASYNTGSMEKEQTICNHLRVADDEKTLASLAKVGVCLVRRD